MAGTTRSDDGDPAPQGGGAAERLREFRAARGEPLEDAVDDGTTTSDETTAPPEDAEPPEDGDRSGDDRADGP